METGVVRHIAAVDPTLPVAVPLVTREGGPWGTIAGADGARHFVRLLPLMPGRNASATVLSREAIRDFGAVSARLGRATRGYFHPMAGRPILWDVKHLAELRPHLPWWRTRAAGRSSNRSSTASRSPSARAWPAFGPR